MHELGVVFRVIDIVEDVAKENNLTEVSSVTLELGEVCTVVEEYLQDIWKWAINRTQFLKHCVLYCETIEAITYCEDCKQTYPTVQYGKTCPHCGSVHTYLLQGNESTIKEIPAEE